MIVAAARRWHARLGGKPFHPSELDFVQPRTERPGERAPGGVIEPEPQSKIVLDPPVKNK